MYRYVIKCRYDKLSAICTVGLTFVLPNGVVDAGFDFGHVGLQDFAGHRQLEHAASADVYSGQGSAHIP